MFAEDLTAFFNTETGFAQLATVNGVSMGVIFDNGYALGNVGMLGMAGAQPTITLQTSSVPASPIGTTVVVGSTSYLVAAHEPDGTGLSRLVLESAA